MLHVPFVLAMLVAAAATAAGCASPSDCNFPACTDCSCVNGICACADGWSGPMCATPFCLNRTGCSGHGDCHMDPHNTTCHCDSGWLGPHCSTATCGLKCKHGGTPNVGCTACEGCQGAWYGVACDVWNSSYPTQQLAARLANLTALAKRKIQSDLKYNPICRTGQECVGWGVDVSVGAVAQAPMLWLDYSGGTPSWRGRKYPKGVDVSPSEDPGFGHTDTRAFLDFEDYKAYVTGLWASEKGQSGWYAQNLTLVRDTVFNWAGHDASPAVTQLPYALVSMSADGSAPLALDPHAKLALQGLGSWSDDEASWRTFFAFWGTSVAATSRLGGLVEHISYPSTALQADHSRAWLVAQALCAFQLEARVGGSCAALDPTWEEYTATAGQLNCLGGGPTLCGNFSAGAWQDSVSDAPRLLDYDAQPLTPFIEDAELSAAVDAAVEAYLAAQSAGRPSATPPVNCSGHGNVSQGATVCTCDNSCYSGRACSVFDYEHPTVSKKVVATVVANDPLPPGAPPAPPPVCPRTSQAFEFDVCTFEPLMVPVRCSPQELNACALSCHITAEGVVQACGRNDAAGGGVSCHSGTAISASKTCTFYAPHAWYPGPATLTCDVSAV
jgi:hypothetical protein